MSEDQIVLPYVSVDGERAQPIIVKSDSDGRLDVLANLRATTATGDRVDLLVEDDRTIRSQPVLWDYTGGGPIRAAGEPATGQAMVSLFGRNVSGNLNAVEVEDTGELRIVTLGWDGAAPIRLLAETTGELIVSNQGWNGAAVTQFLLETAGQQTNSIYGTGDVSGVIESLVINPVQVVQAPPDRRPVEAVAIPNAVTDVWTPGLAATVYMDVILEVVNVDGTNDDILEDFGIDYGNDGAAIDRYFGREIPIRAGEVGIRFGPYRIWGDDAIMAEAQTAARLELHVYIVEEGTAS